MMDCAATSDMKDPVGPDEIKQILRYTVYRAISESDDAKGQNDCSISLVAAASSSRNSSARSRSRSLTVRSCGKTSEIQQAMTFQIQKAMEEIVTEFELLEQAMYLQIDPYMSKPKGHPYFYVWHDAAVDVRIQFVSLFQKKSRRFKTWKAFLQELEQKGWSTEQDIQCVTRIHNDVTRWAPQLELRVHESELAETYGNLSYKCSRSIGKLTTRDSPDMVRVINTSPFEELEFEMRAIHWALVSICKRFDPLQEDGDSDSD